jgi:hypothetical protein
VIRRAARARKTLPLFILFAATVFSVGCANRSEPPLTHQAYIWQRQWTPALDASVSAGTDHFSGWRVLALETSARGELIEVAPHLDVLAHTARPVTLVARLNGSSPPPSVETIAASLRVAVAKWRDAGVRLSGIEIDHDCATAGLDIYVDWLGRLRSNLPAQLTLSITALPTWIGAPALPRLLAQVDESVLQVHAVTAPQADRADQGLFNAQRARSWIDAYAALTPRPFRVALPAYGLRVGFDTDGRAIAVESEMPRAIDAGAVHELRVEPQDVSALLRTLEHSRPKGLAGIVWFRLPSADDRRAWSLQTLRAVIDDAPLRVALDVRLDPSESGARDVVLLNRGAVDAPLPAQIVVRATACSEADGLAGFRAETQADGEHFVRQTTASQGDAILRAGRERRVGWLRCESVDGVTIHALE